MNKVIDINAPENIISGRIIDIGFHIHKNLSAGLLESAYEEALVYFLQKEGLSVERQKSFDIKIENHNIPSAFRADLIVENTIICEIKSVEKLIPIHTAQIMTYLRLSELKIGLLMNFGDVLFKNGLKRIVV